MIKLKVFTQPTCPKCPAAKKTVEEVATKFDVEYYDIKTEDGLAEALSFDIMSTPSMVILDEKGRVVKDWLGQAPTVDELSKFAK